jgi:hypothetical protein
MLVQAEDPNIISGVAATAVAAPARPFQRGVLPFGSRPSKNGRYSVPVFTTAWAIRAAFAAAAESALRRRSASVLSRAM